jgi:uncharacterized protein YjiS (DUF1127 family)
MLALIKKRGSAVTKHNTSLSLHRDAPRVHPSLYHAVRELCVWWRKLQNAKILEGLSEAQLRDCGIEPPKSNVPVIEVPRELMRRLPSPLVMD